MSRKHYTPERFRPHKFGPPKRKRKCYAVPLSPTAREIAKSIEGTFEGVDYAAIEREQNESVRAAFAEAFEAEKREMQRAYTIEEIRAKVERDDLLAFKFRVPSLGIPTRFADMVPVEVTPPRPWWAYYGDTFGEALDRHPFAVLNALVNRIKFGLSVGSTFGFRLEVQDRSWFQHAEILDFVIYMNVQDRAAPPRLTSIAAGFPITHATRRNWLSERVAVRWIRDQVASLLVHELDESLTVDGDRMFDPHDPRTKIPGAL